VLRLYLAERHELVALGVLQVHLTGDSHEKDSDVVNVLIPTGSPLTAIVPSNDQQVQRVPYSLNIVSLQLELKRTAGR